MKTTTFLALLLSIFLAQPAHAESTTPQKDRGDTFADYCRTAVEFHKNGLEAATAKQNKEIHEFVADMTSCYQYLRGFIEGHNMTADHSPATKQFCIPDGVNQIQLARIVVNASDNYPEITHHHRETLVEAALKQAFPCEG